MNPFSTGREGLQIRQKARKRRSVGSAAQGPQRFSARFKDHVWSYDFIFDRTEDGRPLKILVLVDEYTRECLLLHVARRIKGRDVVDSVMSVMSVMAERGVPRFLRSDNGPEFIAREVRDWLEGIGASTLYIEPGSPWQNAYVESFNGKLRDEHLNCELFTSLAEARVLTADWRDLYNHHRPHTSLGGLTPSEFAAASSGHGPRNAPRNKSLCSHSFHCKTDISSPALESVMRRGRKLQSGDHPTRLASQAWCCSRGNSKLRSGSWQGRPTKMYLTCLGDGREGHLPTHSSVEPRR